MNSRITNLLFVFLLPPLGFTLAGADVILRGFHGFYLTMFFIGFALTGLGITLGFHRLVAHKSFETSGQVKFLLLVLGSMAVEGPVVRWASRHVKHHATADSTSDPHCASAGFWYSHWGWLITSTESEVGPDLLAHFSRDPVIAFVSRTFPFWVLCSYLIPYLAGGWEGFIWGGLARQFAVQQVTFLVNSICHKWGTRPFATPDQSRNNWLVAILGFGEGWHNNHHAFPSAAVHGFRWWEFDPSGIIIQLLGALKLAWNVKRPSPEQFQRKLIERESIGQYVPQTSVMSLMPESVYTRPKR